MIPGNTVADSRSPAPPACCRSLPKHHVVWNCLGVVGSEMYIDFFGRFCFVLVFFVCLLCFGGFAFGWCLFLGLVFGGDFITAFWPVTVHF